MVWGHPMAGARFMAICQEGLPRWPSRLNETTLLTAYYRNVTLAGLFANWTKEMPRRRLRLVNGSVILCVQPRPTNVPTCIDGWDQHVYHLIP